MRPRGTGRARLTSSRSVQVAREELQRAPVRERRRWRVVRAAVPAVEAVARGIDEELGLPSPERGFHLLDLVERDSLVLLAVVELHRALDRADALEMIVDRAAVVAHRRIDVGRGRGEVREAPTHAI